MREFIEKSFEVVHVKIVWHGEGTNEVGICKASGKVVVRIDPKYFRPAEVDQLLGDPGKAERLLGWKRTVGFEDLVREMVGDSSCYNADGRFWQMLLLRGIWWRITIRIDGSGVVL